jgi:predicted secreted hydrolase
MKTVGELKIGGQQHRLNGESWFDHEWATNQLAPGQVGWNWLSLQLSDGSDLMLYQMRLKNGGIDPGSNGTWIRPDGTSVFLKAGEYRMQAVRYWKSPQTGAQYPVEWEVEVPAHGLRIRVSTPMENQELVMQPVVYWEGAVEAAGNGGAGPLKGRGYLEMTGYAGALVGLTAPDSSDQTSERRP